MFFLAGVVMKCKNKKMTKIFFQYLPIYHLTICHICIISHSKCLGKLSKLLLLPFTSSTFYQNDITMRNTA
jgi:hypothetical protein